MSATSFSQNTISVLITGANGQLGHELQRTAPAGYDLTCVDVQELDITDANAVNTAVENLTPDLIINAAAYTAVDKAEQEPELAFAINRDGAANLARAATTYNARLIHISTDFIFDGTQGHPYKPQDQANPLGVYGASKWQGEQQVNEITNGQALILRTAWVYSSHGANFVKTMLRLMDDHDQLAIVSDQVGSPTWAHGLAQAIWGFAQLPDSSGTFHWTDAGVASWYDFAVAIQDEALALNLLSRQIPIKPIITADYPTPAKRPHYSVLDKTQTWQMLGYTAPHWREALRQMLSEVKSEKE
jgi:dTDP-4-dehydrorhamnose reductase